uniref:Lom-AG-myotropin-2 n=1 Tax=Locusta migratoria TaxID=7004 RepID=LMA2_LOCMI|nr:RecName: Full=Lom-AG-myotropin-2; AltName: Full=Accessory gland myotropin II; AltName: Full=Lom-AG-myotropin II [Locusta migratoria]prf//1805261A myotropin:ISOTYPE=II [Locusta migratoria]
AHRFAAEDFGALDTA